MALEADLDESYNVFRYYGGFADKIYGKTIETDKNKFAYVLQEPLGVCAQIIPWNFPFMMLAWKVAPALACGNTVVLKSAEQTPLSALYFGKLVIEAGLPAGVVNVVSGFGGTTGSVLASHLGVDKVAFTGSTATGRKIMKAATSNLKNVTLECGGKSPSVVFGDAELSNAVKWTHLGLFDNQGQVCTSTSRIYVQSTIYKEFLDAFVAEAKAAVIGNQWDEGVTQGPQVTKSQYEKILSYIEKGQEEGARLLLGGTKSEKEKGYFINPTGMI